MASVIPETTFEGELLRSGLYRVTSDLGSVPKFPYVCNGNTDTHYKNRIFYILNGNVDKIATCPAALIFSVCEYCFHTLPAFLQSLFIPVFVSNYEHPIKCSSSSLRKSLIDDVKCVVYNGYIINVEYKVPTESAWNFADVGIDASTLTVKVPVAECEFRVNIISGFYVGSNEYSTYTLNSVDKDLRVLTKLFEKNFYTQHGSNKITISKSKFDATTNSAQALKFTAVSKTVAESASSLTSVAEVKEYGHNRLHLCVHSAKTLDSVETRHYGIACDGYCGRESFMGARYYCNVCNFDLCQSCHDRGYGHTHTLYRTMAQLAHSQCRLPYIKPFSAGHSYDSIGYRGGFGFAEVNCDGCNERPRSRGLDSLPKMSYTTYKEPTRGLESASSRHLGSLFSSPAPAPAFAAASAPAFAPRATESLFTGAVTSGSVQSNVTSHVARFGEHRDLIELFIQIFCTSSSAVDAISDKFKATVVPTVTPRWTTPTAE